MKKSKGRAIRALDLFAGAGGSSLGAKLADVQIVGAVDLWKMAGEVYRKNFPTVAYFNSPCESLRPSKLKEKIGRIDLLLASPECTNHTCAKGSGTRSEESRNTAFQVVRFAKALQPRWIVVEKQRKIAKC